MYVGFIIRTNHNAWRIRNKDLSKYVADSSYHTNYTKILIKRTLYECRCIDALTQPSFDLLGRFESLGSRFKFTNRLLLLLKAPSN